MSRQTYANLLSLLKTKLENIVDSGTPPKTILQVVYDYGESQPSGYPYANILVEAGDGEPIDSARNQRNFVFRIDLYQEYNEGGKTKAEAKTAMIGAIDAIIASFDTDKQLGGNVTVVRVVPVRLDTTVQAGVFLFASFEIRIVDLVNNY